MRELLVAAAAAGFVTASAVAGLACTYHSAEADHNMTVAEAPTVDEKAQEGASTFDPKQLRGEEAEKAD